jgi:probable O-glycosylation ligase (exosortase A-associated)
MLRLLFVGAVLVTGMVASLGSRFAALLTYVWFALFRPQEWLWFDVSSLRLSLVLGLLLVIPSLLTGVLPNVTHPLSLGTLAFLGSVLTTHVAVGTPASSWPWVDQFARMVVVVLLSVTLLTSRQRLWIFVAVLAGSLGFHTAKAGLASLLGGGVHFAEGLGGAFRDNNGYAAGAAMIIPLMLALWQTSPGTTLGRWSGRAFAVAVPLSILMIVGTMSRGGFLGLAAGMGSWLLMQRRRFLPIAALALAVTVALPFVPMPEGYLDRMQTIQTFDEVGEQSALSRLYFWQVAVKMAGQNAFGVGLRRYDEVYDQYDETNGLYGTNRSVHSSHFQVLAELGYPGFAIWGLLFVTAIWLAWRARQFGRNADDLSDDERRFFTWMATGLLASMAAFIVGCAFVALALNDITWYTFGVVAALDRLRAARQRELLRTEPAAPEEFRLRATA